MLEKEGGVITEQTYQILVNITNDVQNAMSTLDQDYSVDSNPTVLEMRPEEQTIPFSFRLLIEDVPEVREGFGVVSSSTGALQYSPPTTLFAATTVAIDDNDRTFCYKIA